MSTDMQGPVRLNVNEIRPDAAAREVPVASYTDTPAFLSFFSLNASSSTICEIPTNTLTRLPLRSSVLYPASLKASWAHVRSKRWDGDMWYASLTEMPKSLQSKLSMTSSDRKAPKCMRSIASPFSRFSLATM